jgi:hypothetical protein
MKYFTPHTLAIAALGVLSAVCLSGCANPYDINANCEGGRYQPPYYGTYPDSSYYDNDYYKNYERSHSNRTDHRYDSTYGPNQVYHPSDRP